MRSATTLLLVSLLVATLVGVGCAPSATEAPTTTPEPVSATEPPEPTATAEATEGPPTEEPTVEPTEPVPSPTSTELPEGPTASPKPEQPTATLEPTSEPAEPEGQTLLETRCTVCHSSARVERAQKPREAWKNTVERMVGYGAQLSDAEQEVLVDYLAETYGP